MVKSLKVKTSNSIWLQHRHIKKVIVAKALNTVAHRSSEYNLFNKYPEQKEKGSECSVLNSSSLIRELNIPVVDTDKSKLVMFYYAKL